MKTFLNSVALVALLAGLVGGVEAPHPVARPVAATPLAYADRMLAGRHILAYDSAGDGRVVEVLGNLATADQIAVVVPGSGHNLGNFWTSTSGAAPRRDGVNLLAEMRRQGGGSRARVAVVVWLGYDTPEALDLVAARSDRAVAGTDDLVRLTQLLSPSANVTLIGHSYGSVVVGYAARAARADNLVLIASPGVDVRSVADLHTAAKVWAARGPRDPIGLVPSIRIGGLGHGADPVSSGFGARAFETGEISGHDHYYQPGSESLANLARIALGRTEQVSLAGQAGGSR